MVAPDVNGKAGGESVLPGNRRNKGLTPARRCERMQRPLFGVREHQPGHLLKQLRVSLGRNCEANPLWIRKWGW